MVLSLFGLIFCMVSHRPQGTPSSLLWPYTLLSLLLFQPHVLLCSLLRAPAKLQISANAQLPPGEFLDLSVAQLPCRHGVHVISGFSSAQKVFLLLLDASWVPQAVPSELRDVWGVW